MTEHPPNTDTPAEAIEKACLNNPTVRCRAEKCMAWRWAGPEFEIFETSAGRNATIKDHREALKSQAPVVATWEEDRGVQVKNQTTTARWRRTIHERRGFCGVAGPFRTY